MNLISWNRQGGNSQTVREIATFARPHSPMFVFLCETRKKSEKMRRVRSRLSLKGFDGVDSDGTSGGLALFSHGSCVVDILDKDSRYIDALVKTHANAKQWRVTFVYRDPREENCYLMWNKLKALKQNNDRPWLVIGDFNEALWDFEHLSDTPRLESQMVAFKETLETCELVDLGFSGVPFTYDNNWAGTANVRLWLDRAKATNSWRNLFPFYFVTHVLSSCSDHVALVLKGVPELGNAGPRARQYEVFWEWAPSLPDVIKEAWDSVGAVDNLGKLQSALNKTMAILDVCNNKKFVNVGNWPNHVLISRSL